MSSLKEIKTRINSVKSTLKITSAMKMVAAAKLHKAQNAIGNKLPYEQKLHRILAGLLQSDDLREALVRELGFGNKGGRSPVVLQDVAMDELPSKKDVERVALVVFSSNSSLCGAFNANVLKMFSQTLGSLYERGYSESDIDVYAVGRKAADAALKAGFAQAEDFSDLADKPSYDRSADLAAELVDSFSTGNVSQVIFVYSHFASTSSQPVIRENYLPLALHDYASGSAPIDYILEPDPMSLVKELLPKVLFLKMYTVILDANAAEHAARTVAMQIATDNAQDLIAELTLAYNKGRQQEITAEILDLIGGTMA
jgi:F-type H+-transporting ATPase subunit gamma